jgi:hypothetical protein
VGFLDTLHAYRQGRQLKEARRLRKTVQAQAGPGSQSGWGPGLLTPEQLAAVQQGMSETMRQGYTRGYEDGWTAGYQKGQADLMARYGGSPQ